MLAVSGVGALCGGLYLASRQFGVGAGPRDRAVLRPFRRVGHRLRVFAERVARCCRWCSPPAIGLMVQMAASNTILQTLVEDDKRARVMGLYTMMVLGMVPDWQPLLLGLGGDHRAELDGRRRRRDLAAWHRPLRPAVAEVACCRPADARKSRPAPAAGRRPAIGHGRQRSRRGVKVAAFLRLRDNVNGSSPASDAGLVCWRHHAIL